MQDVQALSIMKYIGILLRAILPLMATGQVLAQALSAPLGKNLDIYLLMGQSNMAGRGKITDDYKSMSDPRVLMLNKANEWVTASHPLHFDKSVAGVGPGLAFGVAMADASSGRKIGLIPCAVGGTSINKWLPGAYDSPTRSHPWDDAEARILAGMKQGVIKGVIWHQGESDSNPDSAAVYLDRLSSLISRVRMLVNNEKLPFIVGQLGQYKTGYMHINKVLPSLPEKVPHTGVVSSEGLVHNGDGIHFDSPSADELGKRYATKMKEMR